MIGRVSGNPLKKPNVSFLMKKYKKLHQKTKYHEIS